MILYIVVFCVGLGFYTVFFIWSGKNMNGTIDWNQVKSDIFSAWIAPVAAILFSILALFYFIRNPTYSVYLALMISCLAVGLSIASLSFSIISR